MQVSNVPSTNAMPAKSRLAFTSRWLMLKRT